jgi:hypothetical protein
MEGTNCPPGSRMQGVPFGSLDLHGNSMETHAPNSGKQIFSNSQIPGTLTMTMNRASEPDVFHGFQFKDGRSDNNHHQHSPHSKNVMIDDEGHYMTEDATNTPSDKGMKASMWHRMKWTDSMVKLLITAVSYTGDDHGADLGGGRRNSAMMQKKGKWRAISKVMGERDCHVSPQQCEDKFNDLNKRYKRLLDILGRGTACDVVAKPELLRSMNHLSDKMKDDAKKLLNSKQLFFEEMCSYHNKNRRNLPEDPALQHSLLLALRSKEDHDPIRDASGDADEDDKSVDSDHEKNDDEEQHPVHTNMREPSMDKWACHGDAALLTSSSHEGIKRSDSHGIKVDINKDFPDGTNWALLQQELASQSLEIRKRLLQIEEKNLELKTQRVKWDRFRRKKDREIERMEMENEYMMIENKQLELELRQKELELELKLKGQVNHA